MEAVKVAIKALTETVEAGSKNMEVCSMTSVPLPSSNSFFRAFLPAEMAFVCSYDSSAAKPTLLANVYLVICPAGKIYSCASQRLLLALSLSKLPVLQSGFGPGAFASQLACIALMA